MTAQRYFALLLLLQAASTAAQEDSERWLSADLGVGVWKYDFEGTIATDPTGVDLQIDLGLGDDTDQQYFLDLRFAHPLVPNLRFEHSTVVTSGARDLGRDVVFAGVGYPAPAGLRSRLTYQDNHLTAYYPALRLGDFSVDLGLGVKAAESGFNLRSTFTRAETEFDETFPMLFVGLDFAMLSGWSLSARMHALAGGDNRVLDGSVALNWKSPWPLGIQFGYRHLRLELEDTGDYQEADLNIFGAFGNLTYRF